MPLHARGETTGALALFVSGPTRQYGPDDLALAEELAGRAALAVDNARLYREARRAIQVRDEFLSVAAHELKTPITTLLGFAQLLLSQLNQAEGLDERIVGRALRAVEQGSKRMSRLVSQILDVSRLDGGRLVLDRRGYRPGRAGAGDRRGDADDDEPPHPASCGPPRACRRWSIHCGWSRS